MWAKILKHQELNLDLLIFKYIDFFLKKKVENYVTQTRYQLIM